MALSIDYHKVLTAAVAEHKTAEQIRVKFRGGGKENMVKAMKQIVEELKGINDKEAIAIANMAKAVIAESVAVVVKPVEQTPPEPVPWWKGGQSIPKKQPKQVVQAQSIDIGCQEEQTAPQSSSTEVVPKFENEKGLFRVVKIEDDKGENYQLHSLIQGNWKTIMSTRMYNMRAEQINLFNKVSEKFAEKKHNVEFTATINGNKTTFFWVVKEGNPTINYAKSQEKNGEKNVPGRLYISFKQVGFFQGLMDQFNEIECCKNSVG